MPQDVSQHHLALHLRGIQQSWTMKSLSKEEFDIHHAKTMFGRCTIPPLKREKPNRKYQRYREDNWELPYGGARIKQFWGANQA